jgi:hypothetical protein
MVQIDGLTLIQGFMTFWIELVVAVVAIPLSLYLFYAVHLALKSCCFWHARRYCHGNQLKINRLRHDPEIDKTGVKTEFTVIDIDCADAQENRRFIRLFGLAVWNPLRPPQRRMESCAR